MNALKGLSNSSTFIDDLIHCPCKKKICGFVAVLDILEAYLNDPSTYWINIGCFNPIQQCSRIISMTPNFQEQSRNSKIFILSRTSL